MATYVGWLMHRTVGGLTAGLLFILPSFLSILALSVAYAPYQQTDLVGAAFFGLKPAVLAIVLQAVIRIGGRVLKNGIMATSAALSFVAIFLFDVPFPLLIAAAGGIGLVVPGRFVVVKGHTKKGGGSSGPVEGVRLHSAPPTLLRAAVVLAVFAVLWAAPLIALALALGPSSVFVWEGLFFSGAAVV